MAIVDELVIAFGVDKKKLDSGLKGVEGMVKQVTKSIMGFLAPLAGGLAFGKLFGDYTREADQLGKFAASIGENIQTIDAWGEAVKHAGGTAEGFQGSLRALNQKVVETGKFAKGEGVELFKAFGISVKNASGEIRASSEVMLDLAGAAEGMDKAQFVGLAQKLGVDHGTIMLLQQGKKSVQELVSAGKELAYKQEDADNAAAYNDAMQDLGKSFKSVAAIILRIITPAITFFTNKATELFKFLNKHGAFVKILFGEIAIALTALLLPAFLAFSKAVMKSPLGRQIMLLTALALVLDDLWTHVNGGKSAFGGLWNAMGLGEDTLDNFKLGIENLNFENIKLVLKQLGKDISDAFLWPVTGLPALIKPVIEKAFGASVDFVKSKFEELWDKLKAIFTWLEDKLGVIKEIGDAVNKAHKIVGGAADSVVDGFIGKTEEQETAEMNQDLAFEKLQINNRARAGNNMPQYVAAASAPASALASPAEVSNHTEIQNNLGSITINTAATDAAGIASGIGGALNNELIRSMARNAALSTK